MDASMIVTRARSVLLTPRVEWPVIATEPDTVGGVYSHYIIAMAAIPAVARLISSTLIGIRVPFLGYYRVGIVSGITTALITYVLALIGVYIVAWIADALAPTFRAEHSRVQALKTVAYAYTASWVASIIGIIPGLGLISALAGAIYGIYLFRLGLPVTMKCPQEKAVAYTAVTIILAIVVAIILNLIVGSVAGIGLRAGGGLGAYGYTTTSTSGAFAPGTAGAGLQAWARNVQTASQVDATQQSNDANAQANAVGQLLGAALGSSGNVEALAPDRIKTFLPDNLNGLRRTQFAVERNTAMGVQVSKATATYSNGTDRTLNLQITDTGSLKGLVGFASGWAGAEQDRETDTGNAVGSLDLAGLAALRNEGVQARR